MKSNYWVTVKNMSLAAFTRNAGFDLAVYDEYSDGARKELRKRAINEAVKEIEASFESKEIDISTVTKGIYVISLSHPLTVDYRNNWSQVIYIGIGSIVGRIKGHLQKSLFDFMQSLAGANFDFHFAKPEHPHHKDYYKHIEYLMLENFGEVYGGTDEKRRFPILNKNAGSNKGIADAGDWWRKPLKNAGKRPLWSLSPTKFSDFAPLG